MWGILTLIALLSGCSTMAKLVQKPKVTAKDAEIRALSFQKLDLQVNLEIENPNPVGVTLSGYDYKVTLEGKEFVQGRVKETIAIPSQGTSSLPVPVSIIFAEAAGAVEGLVTAKEVNYTVEVELYFTLPVIDEVSIKAAHSGKFPVPRVPTFIGATVTVEKIDFRGAEAVFSLTAGNPNIFPLLITEMDAALVVSGDTWAEVGLTATGPVEIPPAGEQRLEFPMKMDFLALGKTAFNLLFRGGELDFSLQGGVGVDAGLPFFQETSLPLNLQGAADIERTRKE